MKHPERKILKSGEMINVAFPLVVLISLFSSFSTQQTAEPLKISAMILLGIAYLAFGIYGMQVYSQSQLIGYRLAYLVLQTLIGSLLFFLAGSSSFNILILLPLVGQSVLLFESGWLFGANFLIFLAFLTINILLIHTPDSLITHALSFLAGQLFIVIFTQMAVDEEKARLKIQKMADELMKANTQLRDYADKVEELTLTKERNRLAHEIHDGLGHALTTIHMQIQAAQAIGSKDPEKAAEILKSAHDLTTNALNDIRDSIFSLRASPEPGLALHEQLNRLVNHSRTSNLSPTFSTQGRPVSLNPIVEFNLYRIAQEGISNTIKHSAANRLWVKLDYSKLGSVILTIRDNGTGAQELSEGFGLKGLRERVGAIHGKLEIKTSPRKGVVLKIEVPA
jgi:signal transduction histidine kinase